VSFNGTKASFTVNSPTQITATVPMGALQGPISVTNASGTSSYGVFVLPPEVNSFSPLSGNAGTQVTITGKNLAVDLVTFNGTAANILMSGPTQIVAQVPDGATTGLISVRNSAGSNGTGALLQDFIAATPLITSFSPASGPVGTQVAIFGTGFTGATDVQFGNVSVGGSGNFSVNGEGTQIMVNVPVGATTGPISVFSPNAIGGFVSSANNFFVNINNAPTITGFSPQSGAAGTSVTITGMNFSNVEDVLFNGISVAGNFTVNSSTQITATVPMLPSGFINSKGAIRVVTSAGNVDSADQFTTVPANANQAPNVTALDVSGNAGGIVLVRISGSNLAADSQVFFIDSSGASQQIDPSQISFDVDGQGLTSILVSLLAPGPMNVAVEVKNPNQIGISKGKQLSLNGSDNGNRPDGN
jgi:hypothetical protein